MPFPQENNTYNLNHQIEIPVSPIEWYLVIKNSKGYVGNNMHPIVSSIHNRVPFFVFDHYTGKSIIGNKSYLYQSKVYEVLALVCGSAQYDGSITLTFSKELKKVKLYSSPNFAFAYDKDSGEFVPSFDGYCCISVNNENWELGSFDVSEGIKKSEKEFVINSNTLTLSGAANQRVLTYAMTFTF